MAIPVPVDGEFDVFSAALEAAARAQQPLYVEFGVYEGSSMIEWARRVQNPQARFVGFDSFEGLPERWSDSAPPGYFSTDGKVPQTDDLRVSFVKGWFDQTVPGFVAPKHDLLIVNMSP